MFGVEILFKDGSKDRIDPIEEEPKEVEGFLKVYSVLTYMDLPPHQYTYELKDIEKWSIYEFTIDQCLK